MFEKIDVWSKHDAETVTCYRVFRSLESGLYSVQSKDFIRSVKDAVEADTQVLELFLEESPSTRSEGFKTLEAAIQSFDAEFED